MKIREVLKIIRARIYATPATSWMTGGTVIERRFAPRRVMDMKVSITGVTSAGMAVCEKSCNH